ncbi:outer membrane beta-barrel protein [Limnovirga soli]|uniref:Outer membrane beta-barrel protein n=1 Tax=Limnovirga soli TaxID=2656915 RepID=A0A8J8FFP0_9BACT|nr:outer membrane beta-barrel protein [Limnovirga soli]NNV57043.1 outer membrane beta-barrel protein [Limnovirga soli]
MKKTIYMLVLVTACFAFSGTVIAQTKPILFGLNYNYAAPLGGFKSDVISNGSARGFSGSFMYPVNKKWQLGLSAGFQDFYQKYPRDIYTTGNHETTSAVLSNSIQIIPVLAKATYLPMGNSNTFIQPYISAASGISLVDFRQYLGEFGSNSSNAVFTVQAGAGITMPFKRGKDAGLDIGAGYNYVGYQKFGINNLNHLTANVGVHFPLR